ncbi:hypothetical protein HHI36_005021 [Cryptolaemus montrouzieri]|uniref:DNA topoisomerase (ATP-hydrolyzing) n=1 Tax=Cryptolaemus montrouzieri TaxID=559131 RepID=A0ABD2NSY7_9CUCU
MKKEGKFKVYSLISACTEKFNDKSISSASTSTYLDDINFPNTGKREADEKILKGLNEVCMDKSLLYIEEEDNIPHHGRGPKYTMWRICAIFEDVLQKFAMKKSPELSIRKQTFEECSFYKGRLVLKPCENPRMIRINFRNALSQPKFCLILYILAKVLDLLDNKSKSTKREIYYQIKNLISNQGKVDNALKAVSCMLGLGPWDLNIISHKGLVFGNLKITMSTNEVINCNIPGTLIPQEVDDIVELEASAYFILVVEKESIFFKLLDENLPHRLTKPFIMITGKGFPDLNTQLFLRKLWIVMSIPVFILTDADPHGVNIMIAYRFGSLANAHISDQLAVPKAKWLGVFPSEILKLNAEKQSLTENERRVVKNILKTPYIKGNPRIEQELKILLEFNYKTGIEGIMKNNNFLSEFYFPMKFHSRDLI